MKRIKIDDDNWCAVRTMNYPKTSMKKQRCIECGEVFIAEDEVVMFVNNYTIFPNCMMHKSCMDNFKDEKDCIEILKWRYENAKRLRKEADQLWPDRMDLESNF